MQRQSCDKVQVNKHNIRHENGMHTDKNILVGGRHAGVKKNLWTKNMLPSFAFHKCKLVQVTRTHEKIGLSIASSNEKYPLGLIMHPHNDLHRVSTPPLRYRWWRVEAFFYWVPLRLGALLIPALALKATV